jgi:hypothetical protein
MGDTEAEIKAKPGKGGKRKGAGRPLGAKGRKFNLISNEPDQLLPVDYMLALMRNEQCEPWRRDQMAVQAAPYCHPRLNAVGITGTGAIAQGGALVSNNSLQIFSIPRGGSLDPKGGVVTIDGEVAENLPTIEPFKEPPTGMPQLNTEMSERIKDMVPLEVQLADTSNVRRLDKAFNAAMGSVARRRPDDDSAA